MTQVFCAIDAPDLETAQAALAKLGDAPVHIKLGLEFFVAEGPQGLALLRKHIALGAEIFLDLKLHDIPNTVAGSIRAAVHHKPQFITIHTAGGRDMMRAAVFAARDEAEKSGLPRPKILGVTVLTHLDAHDLESVGQNSAGQNNAVEEQVLRLAQLAKDSGLDGIVCSPHEIASLRLALGRDFLLVVPGIRLESSESDDQKRTMTPPEAGGLGADYLVIGRPITKAADPASAARAIVASLR